jgi:hypothetical protein
MWAINGVASVLGSVLATGIGIMMGLSTAMLIALACYAAVFLSTLTWRRMLQRA